MGSNKRKASVVVHQNGKRGDDGASGNDMPPSAKKRRGDDSEGMSGNDLDTSKPSALFVPKNERKWTVSMAVPGSIIANVNKPDHKTLLAGRLARAAAVFCIDEIIIFDDDPTNIPNNISTQYRSRNKSKQQILDAIPSSDQAWQHPDQFLFHILSYAECPPYLRRADWSDPPEASLFPQHDNLKWAGMLPSLDMPHHLKNHEWCKFREGVSIGPVSDSQRPASYVKCGLPFPVVIPADAPIGSRVTLKFARAAEPPSWPNLTQQQCEGLAVSAVSAAIPREEQGYYWGYSVRRASCISDVLTESEFPGGYDVVIGTSERGAPLPNVLPAAIAPRNAQPATDAKILPDAFKHLLIVFGGVAGLEPAVATDPKLKGQLTKETASELFDGWVNLVQGQGSRTIRTEEAIEFGLFGLKGYVDSMYD